MDNSPNYALLKPARWRPRRRRGAAGERTAEECAAGTLHVGWANEGAAGVDCNLPVRAPARLSALDR